MQGYGRGFTAIQRASDNVIEEDVLNSSYLSGAPNPKPYKPYGWFSILGSVFGLLYNVLWHLIFKVPKRDNGPFWGP